MTQYLIVVGHVMNGIDKVVGPFDSEADASEFGHGNGGDDRYEQWGTIGITTPKEEEDAEDEDAEDD